MCPQERFVKLDDNHLRYYKHEGDSHEAGSIDLDAIDWVRPDKTHSTSFEIYDIENDRVYYFEAPDVATMKMWVEALEGTLSVRGIYGGSLSDFGSVKSTSFHNKVSSAVQDAVHAVNPIAMLHNAMHHHHGQGHGQSQSQGQSQGQGSSVSLVPSVNYSGTLLKKSHNKFQLSLQVRRRHINTDCLWPLSNDLNTHHS